MIPANKAGSEQSVPLLQSQPSFSVQRSGYSASSIPGAVPFEVVPLPHAGPPTYLNGFCPPNPGMARSPSWSMLPVAPMGSTGSQMSAHRAGSMHAPAGTTGIPDAHNRNGAQSNISHGKFPLFVKVLNICSVLVIVSNAPTAIFFSYFLFLQTSVLFGAPLASFFGVAAVYMPKWGHKLRLIKSPLRMVKLMKFLAMTALTFDFIGAFLVPLIMFSVVCPHVGYDSCHHDVPMGGATSVLTAFLMVMHGALLIMLRVNAVSVVTGMVGEDEMRLAMEQEADEEENVAQSLASFPNGGNRPLPLGYTSFPCYRPVPGVPIFPSGYQPWRG